VSAPFCGGKEDESGRDRQIASSWWKRLFPVSAINEGISIHQSESEILDMGKLIECERL
jgi:hypothetical protein